MLKTLGTCIVKEVVHQGGLFYITFSKATEEAHKNVRTLSVIKIRKQTLKSSVAYLFVDLTYPKRAG